METQVKTLEAELKKCNAQLDNYSQVKAKLDQLGNLEEVINETLRSC